MTPIAPDIEAYLREHLARQRDASPHTCDSYAFSFQLLFEFAAKALKVSPSQLTLEQLDATLISDFLEHLEHTRHNSPRIRAMFAWPPSDRSSAFSSIATPAHSIRSVGSSRYRSRRPIPASCPT